jgi:hypothetical protein
VRSIQRTTRPPWKKATFSMASVKIGCYGSS